MHRILKKEALTEKPFYIDKPPASRVLVIAPHPDDEVIGCGGVLLKHICSGDEVRVCYITSTVSEGCNRKEEALQSNRVLGVNNSIFLNGREKADIVSEERIDMLSDMIMEFAPQIIYIPHIYERHKDHLNSNILLYYALRKCKGKSTNIYIYCYEVWTTLIPDCLVNITDFYLKKVDALEVYKSQLKEYDYISLVDYLGRLRCIMHFPSTNNYKAIVDDYKFSHKYCKKCTLPWTHAEAFRRYDMAEYQRLMEEIV